MKSNDASFARAHNDEPRPRTMFLREESRGVARLIKPADVMSPTGSLPVSGPTRTAVKLNSVMRDLKNLVFIDVNSAMQSVYVSRCLYHDLAGLESNHFYFGNYQFYSSSNLSRYKYFALIII